MINGSSDWTPFALGLGRRVGRGFLPVSQVQCNALILSEREQGFIWPAIDLMGTV